MASSRAAQTCYWSPGRTASRTLHRCALSGAWFRAKRSLRCLQIAEWHLQLSRTSFIWSNRMTGSKRCWQVSREWLMVKNRCALRMVASMKSWPLPEIQRVVAQLISYSSMNCERSAMKDSRPLRQLLALLLGSRYSYQTLAMRSRLF